MRVMWSDKHDNEIIYQKMAEATINLCVIILVQSTYFFVPFCFMVSCGWALKVKSKHPSFLPT